MDNSVENSTKRRRNFRPVIFIAVPVLVIVGVVIAILVNKKPAEPPKTNQPETVSTKTEEKKEEKKEEKSEEKPSEETKPEEKEEPEIIEGKTPVQQDQSGTQTGELTGVINYAESDGDTLIIRASIDQYLESGTCLLELTTAGDSFSLSDNIGTSAATSACSFDISTELLVNGKYNIKITLTSGDKTGVIEGEANV